MSVSRFPIPTETRAPGGRTNAYLVDSGALLVDPAGDDRDLARAIERRGVDHVAVTHAHPDHVGGVVAVAGDATVWAHADHAERFEREAGVAPDRCFEAGTEVGPAEVVGTPGHAPDHVAFLLGDVALVGDLAVAEGSVLVGGTDGDLSAYLDSLRRLAERELDRLYPGHGPPIDDPAATLSRLIDRRLDREARVLAAVESGARTPEEVVAAAYDRDLAGVRDLAVLAVRAHLDKLAAEGEIGWDGERARPR